MNRSPAIRAVMIGVLVIGVMLVASLGAFAAEQEQCYPIPPEGCVSVSESAIPSDSPSSLAPTVFGSSIERPEIASTGSQAGTLAVLAAAMLTAGFAATAIARRRGAAEGPATES